MQITKEFIESDCAIDSDRNAYARIIDLTKKLFRGEHISQNDIECYELDRHALYHSLLLFGKRDPKTTIRKMKAIDALVDPPETYRDPRKTEQWAVLTILGN